MPAIILTIAGWFGINPIRLIAYAAILIAVAVGAITIRQHYVNLGWNKAIAAVKKQDDHAIAAAERVEQKTSTCTEKNGWWDVASQRCRLGEE